MRSQCSKQNRLAATPLLVRLDLLGGEPDGTADCFAWDNLPFVTVDCLTEEDELIFSVVDLFFLMAECFAGEDLFFVSVDFLAEAELLFVMVGCCAGAEEIFFIVVCLAGATVDLAFVMADCLAWAELFCVLADCLAGTYELMSAVDLSFVMVDRLEGAIFTLVWPFVMADWLAVADLPFVMAGRLAWEDDLIFSVDIFFVLADCLAGADNLPFTVDWPFVIVDRLLDVADEPDVPGESSAMARDAVADGGVDHRIRLNGGPLNRSSTLRGSGRQGTSDLLKFSYVFIILSRLVSRKGWCSSVTPDLDPSALSKIQCYVFSFRDSHLIYWVDPIYIMKSMWTP